MKTSYIYTLAAIALMGLGACSNQDELLTEQAATTDNVIRFNVGVDEMRTRAEHTNASTIMDFGVAIRDAETKKLLYNNIQVVNQGTQNNQNWVPLESMVWGDRSRKVDIVAYTPYNAGYTDGNVNLFEVAGKPSEILSKHGHYDFLACHIQAFDPNTLIDQQGIDLRFKHTMSKLELFINLLPDVMGSSTNNLISQVMVSGAQLHSTVNLSTATGTLTATGDDRSRMQAEFVKFDNPKAQYQLLMVPQTLTPEQPLSIRIVLYNGEVYEWTSTSDIILAENTRNTLTLQVGTKAAEAKSLRATAW